MCITPSRKKWPIDILGGVGLKYYPGAKTESKMGRFGYLSNDQQVLNIATSFTYVNGLSNAREGHFTMGTPTYELYIGTKKELKNFFLDEIDFGIEAAHGWGFGPRTGNELTFITYKVDGYPASNDAYVDQNFFIGFRLGIRVFH